MTTLGELLGQAAKPGADRDRFLASFGLARNPFPPARTIIPAVMYDQQPALERFAEHMRPILTGELARRSMAVIGGTGGGKSHFLRHCQHHVDLLTRDILTVEFLAGTSSAANLVREILRAADDLVKRKGEQDFLSAIVNRVREDHNFGAVRQSDLRVCLSKLVEASADGYRPVDLHGRFTYDLLREVGRRWIAGGTLTQTERKHLGVSGRLATASLMIRVLTELLALGRECKFLVGVLLCVDEVEALFSSGSSSAKIQAFLQDVRYLFDEAIGKDSGYALLVVSASTATGVTSLRDFNYPLFQRLGFDQEARIALNQLGGIEDAREFANVYLDYERERSGAGGEPRVPIEKTRSLITDADLEELLLRDDRQQLVQISQARLLDQLHSIVERKRKMAGSRGI